MSDIDHLINLTRKELQLFLVTASSSDMITDPLQRFILYSVLDAKASNASINTKILTSESQQSFYRCNQAIDYLIGGDWLLAQTDPSDKRSKMLLPAEKTHKLIEAYEAIKIRTLQQSGYKHFQSPSPLTLDDLISASKQKLEKIKKEILD